MSDKRWPSWVYAEGDEPDYRFNFATERTFLAWLRTALALLAAGVALDVIDLSWSTRVQRGLALLLVALGLVAAVLAWLRWALAERAMRAGKPLPTFGLATVFALGVAVVALVLLLTSL
jgi:putative membrane protein